MDLDAIVFGEITMGQLLYALGGIVAFILLLRIMKKFFFPPKSNLQHSLAFTCTGCGWTGHIGKYTRTCPKCNQPVT